jgi:hypothetical protein
MNEPVYPTNSPKQPQANAVEKRVQKVTSGPVKVKKNELRKLADIFISEDVANVKEYIFMDVLVPAIKKAIFDIVTNGIDMFLYGGRGGAKNNNNATSKVSYRSYYDKPSTPAPSANRGSENAVRSAADYDNIVFNTRGEAEAAKQQMVDIIAQYGIATVSDLYEMTPLTPPFTAQKYGWMCDLSNVPVERTHNGYILKLPRAMALD